MMNNTTKSEMELLLEIAAIAKNMRNEPFSALCQVGHQGSNVQPTTKLK
jgi:hypothetical protein